MGFFMVVHLTIKNELPRDWRMMQKRDPMFGRKHGVPSPLDAVRELELAHKNQKHKRKPPSPKQSSLDDAYSETLGNDLGHRHRRVSCKRRYLAWQ